MSRRVDPRRPSALGLGLALALAGCGGDGSSATMSVVSPRAGHACGLVWEVQWRLGARVRGATPDALDLSRYPLAEDGRFLSAAGTACSDAIADALTALCPACDTAPGECEPLVRDLFQRVPAVCSRCGDDVCFTGETGASCPPDCAVSCGDGLCSALEGPLDCPIDCAEPCGDGRCAGGETAETCAVDCRFAVGDGVCSPGETPASSPEDCGFATCGDGFCQSYEQALRCPEDCCWPRVCDTGYRRCRDAGALETCLASGSDACPERVASEVCEHGCVDPGDGDARCVTCAEAVGDALGPTAVPCAPGAAAACAGDGVRRCVAFRGSATCGFEVYDACPGPCADGACLGACDGCALSWTECEGARVKRCVKVAAGCNQWRVDPAPCGTACVGAEHQGHCQSCLDTGCPDGESCLTADACAPCAPGLCVPGSARCSPGENDVETCQAAPGCTGWITAQRCTGDTPVCRVDGEGVPRCGAAP